MERTLVFIYETNLSNKFKALDSMKQSQNSGEER